MASTAAGSNWEMSWLRSGLGSARAASNVSTASASTWTTLLSLKVLAN